MAIGDADKLWQKWVQEKGLQGELYVGAQAVSKNLNITAIDTPCDNSTIDDDSIYIYGIIGLSLFGMSDDCITSVTATAVTTALKKIGKGKAKVYINSVGGHMDEGIAIYNMLREYGATTYIVGSAASAASLIACAGIHGGGCYFMQGSSIHIHEARAVAQGRAKELLEYAVRLQRGTERMIDIYVEATGLPRDELLTYMQTETEFTAAQAVEKGFGQIYNADSNIEAKVATPQADLDNTQPLIARSDAGIYGDLTKALLLTGDSRYDPI